MGRKYKEKRTVTETNKPGGNTTKTDEPLVSLDTGTDNHTSDEETTAKTGATARRPPPGTAEKRQRISKDTDMEEDFATSSSPASPTSPASSTSSQNSQNA